MKRTAIAAIIMGGLLCAMVAAFVYLGEDAEVGPTVELPPKGDITLRLMTWNVGNSGESGFKAASNEDLDHIAGRINQSSADVICLQEIANAEQLEQLKQKLEQSYNVYSAPRRGRHNSARLIVMLVRADVPVLGAQTLEILTGNDVLTVGLPAGFFLLGVHADAFDPERHRRTFEAIADWVDHPDRAGGHMILMGDLNLDANAPAVEATAGQLHDGESYSMLAHRFHDAGAAAGPTAKGRRRVDYVFVRPPHLPVKDAWVWARQNIGEMDHLPLVVDMTPVDRSGGTQRVGPAPQSELLR